MRVVLAGASNAIGSPLTRRLLAAGHEAVGITRSGTAADRLWDAGVRQARPSRAAGPDTP
ncbi:hypothetical protein NCC78_21925 [Micromonospora phytophila]|uniref:hypothetical protein n=1 Tax=Micromonospora phytophila TaxID=709888 RepID=UPI00202E0579|nr:hypothetical protein [Micromonospora phytophila]MCM0677326.1 hypothetical protein [Micromonospora phytophila]